MAPNGDRARLDAVRLVLTYSNGDVALDEVVYLDKLLPPSDELPEGGPEGELSGFWFELRDGSGEVLYRQIASNPIVDSWSEVIDDREPGGGGFRRVAAVPERKTFTLLVPHPRAEGRHVVIFSSPLDATASGISAPAEPRWRIELPADERE